ncbi:M15 family metallopeptidase [Simiduia litorea]|uniref:M15 family metallopeptidase n=1 Tax=Simiduia litorea TaxID=1435348 RepID=UPI0036F28099
MNTEFTSNPQMLYGVDQPPLVTCLGASVQPALVEPLELLADAASRAGFDLAIASGHRSFERQLSIFNGKAEGARPVLDLDGQIIDISLLSASALLHAILRWSALPGMSRHHWGTDVDIYDRSICRDGYQLQLTVAECRGPMAGFYGWLEEYLAAQSTLVRPYARDLGGVAPEPWHLSYAPLAKVYAQQYSVATLQALLVASDIALKSTIIAQLPELVQRYQV